MNKNELTSRALQFEEGIIGIINASLPGKFYETVREIEVYLSDLDEKDLGALAAVACAGVQGHGRIVDLFNDLNANTKDVYLETIVKNARTLKRGFELINRSNCQN